MARSGERMWNLAGPFMVARGGYGRWLLLTALVCAPLGCQSWQFPRIDPSGNRIFLPCNRDPAASDVAPAADDGLFSKCQGLFSGCKSGLAGPAQAPRFVAEPGDPGRNQPNKVIIAPGKVIAPVGSEVIVLAGVCRGDGFLLANERVEWLLAPGGVGHIVQVGDRRAIDWLSAPRTSPEKFDNTFAVNTTSSRYVALTRGTADVADDVTVLKGQAWVSVTSPLEGTSHVTAFAPAAYGWDDRRPTATIYWVDAQWVLPPPAINPAGSRHVLTTTATRHTNQSPLVNWRVRYEIVSGPAAGFGPDGATVVEVPTDDLGQASAEIFQTAAAAGTNQINVQVIRPAEVLGGDGARLVVGSGTTSKTWTAPELSLRTSGPPQGGLGATLAYRIEIQNQSQLPARQVVVDEPPVAGLELQRSNPAATQTAAGLQWALGDLQPGQSRTIDLSYRATRPGPVTRCATIRTADGLSARDCTTTTVLAAGASTIEVGVAGPEQGEVGQSATFEVTITNRGDAAATGLVIVDRFDPGLEQAGSEGSNTIERALGDLPAGASRRVAITFRLARAGRQCHTIEVHGAQGARATAQACIEVVAAAGGTTAEPGGQAAISVQKQGPDRQLVGEVAEFVVAVTNTGPVPVTNLTVTDNYDASLEPKFAADGFRLVGRDLVWRVDRLDPGQTIRFDVHCRCEAPAMRACNRVSVTTAEGARADEEACLEIRQAPNGFSLRVTDLRDPVAVGNETTYEIRVSNGGDQPQRDVTLVLDIPAELRPLAMGTSGPARFTIRGREVRFAPVAQMGAGETLTYRVRVRADRPGEPAIKATVRSTARPDGVSIEESTTVFAEP